MSSIRVHKNDSCTDYHIDSNDAVQLAPSAAARHGIQSLVSLKVNGAESANVAVGQSVTFTGTAEVPPHAGDVVEAQWDYLGLGKFPSRRSSHHQEPGPSAGNLQILEPGNLLRHDSHHVSGPGQCQNPLGPSAEPRPGPGRSFIDQPQREPGELAPTQNPSAVFGTVAGPLIQHRVGNVLHCNIEPAGVPTATSDPNGSSGGGDA